jgi:hypothetical protein
VLRLSFAFLFLSIIAGAPVLLPIVFIREGCLCIPSVPAPMWSKRSEVVREKDEIRVDAVRLEAALGHRQELQRGFGLFSLTSLGIIIAK